MGSLILFVLEELIRTRSFLKKYIINIILQFKAISLCIFDQGRN